MAVKAAGASFVDALQAAGKYQFAAQPPYVPGGEAAGVVDAIGEGVDGWEVGDRVVVSIGKGAFADHIVALPQQLIRLPDEVDLAVGASFLQVYGTAWFAFKKRTVVRPGEVVLVTGAGGGVGLAAVDVARSLGARVDRSCIVRGEARTRTLRSEQTPRSIRSPRTSRHAHES